MLYVIPDTLLEVVLSINTTGHHVIRYNWHIIGSGVQHQKYWSPCYTFICTTHCSKWRSTAIKLVTMLYAIPDILLKVAFSTNKTGFHVICYTWHIVESGVQRQWNWPPSYRLYLTHCWKWRSTPIKLTNLLYVIPDTLLRVAFNTNKTGHHVIHDMLLNVAFNTNKTGYHVIRYTWHIVESGVQHQ